MYRDQIEYLKANDEVLVKILEKIELPAIVSTKNIFHDLMSCIIEQQIHYRSTKKTFSKLLDKAGIQQLTPENFELFEEKSLSQVKLSSNKSETIFRILENWRETNVDDLDFSNNEKLKRIGQIKGVGQWTLDMIALYTLGEPNVFPYDDFHLKQIMVKVYNLNPDSKLKAQMLAVSDKWGNNKSLAVRYLLEWKNHLKK